jgi:hypothetical protein
MEFCCTSSSSVLWWNTQVPSGGPPLTPISGNCRCFSPSVSKLLPVHLGTSVTSKFMMILVFILYWPHQIPESFESKLADVGNPLVTQLGWYLHWLSVGPGVPKVGRLRSTTSLLPPKVGHVTTSNRDHLALFSYLRLRFSHAISCSCKSNIRVLQRWGTACTLPLWGG